MTEHRYTKLKNLQEDVDQNHEIQEKKQPSFQFIMFLEGITGYF